MQTTPLGSLCDVHAGYAFRSRVEADAAGDTAVVQLGDVDVDAGVGWDRLTRVAGLEPRPHHLVRRGDVLFASKGANNYAVLADEDRPGVIASSTFFLVRPQRTDLRAAYLAWYINQPPAQAHFQAGRRGSYVPSVGRGCLETLPVPVPPKDVQERVVEAMRLAREERSLAGILLAKRWELVNRACLDLATRLS